MLLEIPLLDSTDSFLCLCYMQITFASSFHLELLDVLKNSVVVSPNSGYVFSIQESALTSLLLPVFIFVPVPRVFFFPLNWLTLRSWLAGHATPFPFASPVCWSLGQGCPAVWNVLVTFFGGLILLMEHWFWFCVFTLFTRTLFFVSRVCSVFNSFHLCLIDPGLPWLCYLFLFCSCIHVRKGELLLFSFLASSSPLWLWGF